MSRILVVGVEPQLRRALSLTLRARHYDVRTASDPAQALTQAAVWNPDLVVLDLDVPDPETVAGVHGWSRRPIIVLSGHPQPHAEVAVLDAGADDYITKPFGIDEFLAHVRAVIRRTPDNTRPSIIDVGDLRVDLAGKTVTGPRDDTVHLTPIEWGILEPLLRNPGTLISGQQLLTAVWGPGHVTDTHYLRIYLSSLRHKLEPNPSRPRYLITAPGMGYRFEP
ncbi:winged helix-turn-helix domain-containing protein [Rhodococcus opacus]|uniref:winged helix-turn-helix domain-containing protein n=1 Tax=Rhodococcus opacus TaxID=37919 RepID=UPI0022357125|nr:winged helix-turn-helix domain-containing protein [Rhodococcus opacus]UZG55262.1 winged helix-turn-helix domain-containing protein [Rhodococcus opacus]